MEFELPAIFGVVLLPAVAFSLAYPSLVNRLSRGLVSSYAKADARRRLTAACLDAWVAVTLAVLWMTVAGRLVRGARHCRRRVGIAHRRRRRKLELRPQLPGDSPRQADRVRARAGPPDSLTE